MTFVVSGTSAPQRQTGLRACQRGSMIVSARMPGTFGRMSRKCRGVDLVLSQRKAVATRRRHDDISTQLLTQTGDKYVEGLGRILWLYVRPEPVHQVGGVATRTQIAGEQGKQPAQPGAVDHATPIGHPSQQDQIARHATKIKRCAHDKGGLPASAMGG